MTPERQRQARIIVTVFFVVMSLIHEKSPSNTGLLFYFLAIFSADVIFEPKTNK